MFVRAFVPAALTVIAAVSAEPAAAAAGFSSVASPDRFSSSSRTKRHHGTWTLTRTAHPIQQAPSASVRVG
jgi:hypothetical protein